MAGRQGDRLGYRQVADAIRGDIETGTLGPGQALPSIAELMRTYSISDGTAQRAVGHLRSQGLVESRHGSGSFVRKRRPWIAVSSSWMKPPADGEPDFWTRQTAERGFRGTQQIVYVGTVVPPDDVRDSLELADRDTVVVRERIMYMDEEPVQIVKSYYPHSVADGTPLAQPGKIKGASPAVLATLPDPPVEIHETVTARMPTDEELATLRLNPGTPVIEMFRNAVTGGGRAVDAVVMVLAADRHKLMYRFPV